MKTPLVCVLSVYTNSETALVSDYETAIMKRANQTNPQKVT
jgi:hypothetical protein